MKKNDWHAIVDTCLEKKVLFQHEDCLFIYYSGVDGFPNGWNKRKKEDVLHELTSNPQAHQSLEAWAKEQGIFLESLQPVRA